MNIFKLGEFPLLLFNQVHSKEKKWSLEEEYRTFRYYRTPASINDRRIFIPIECYTSIIFGEMQSEDHKFEIIETCKEKGYNVNFYCSRLVDNNIIINEYWR